MQGHGVGVRLDPVEHHHFTARQLIHHQVAHIGVVLQNGGGIGKHHFLGHGPALREAGVQLPHQLHAVKLRHHPLGPVLLLQRRQLLHGHRVLIQNLQIHIFLGEGRQVILLLPLLKGQQQRPFPGVEPGVLQSLLDEFGLTGI